MFDDRWMLLSTYFTRLNIEKCRLTRLCWYIIYPILFVCAIFIFQFDIFDLEPHGSHTHIRLYSCMVLIIIYFKRTTTIPVIIISHSDTWHGIHNLCIAIINDLMLLKLIANNLMLENDKNFVFFFTKTVRKRNMYSKLINVE